MYCVIQEVPIKKVNCGEARKILVKESTWTMNGKTMTHYYYENGGGHYERPHRVAYKISIHRSYRKAGRVCKQQVSICTICYYDIVDWGAWYQDYISGSRLQDKLEKLGISEDELTEMICKKFDPIADKVKSDFQQSEEGQARAEHRKIVKEYNERKKAFAEKQGVDREQYDYCYDVFGTLRNQEYLKQIQSEYEARKRYEQESRRYYEKNQRTYNDYSGSSYSAFKASNYTGEDRAMLKQFYRTLSKAYHPDSNPGRDTSAEMKLLNQLKNEWGV